jgi:hypothetical protein
MSKEYVPILCLDFDGVLHSYKSGWKGARNIPDPPVDGAIEWLVNLVKSGEWQVCIYSSRSRYWGGRRAMKRWIRQHFELLVTKDTPDCVSFVCQTAFADPWAEEVEYAAKRLVRAIKFPLMKPAAFLQVDDRCICFDGNFPTSENMKQFKPWNKKGK